MSQLQHRAVTEELHESPAVTRGRGFGEPLEDVAATTADWSPRSRET